MTREERTRLIKHLKYNRSIGAAYLITDKDADEIIKALEQEPKTGRWVTHHEPYTWMGYTHWSCSECGYGEEPENHNKTNYCPNCGCRMESEGEE